MMPQLYLFISKLNHKAFIRAGILKTSLQILWQTKDYHRLLSFSLWIFIYDELIDVMLYP